MIKEIRTLSITTTLKIFLMSNEKASLALVQKFCPCTAHIMYAFLLMNLRKFSKHQQKHLQRHMRHLVTGLSNFFSFWSMYSSMTRITRTMAMISAPKATVPK